MILGHGDIASALTDREDVIFFASGVSNSSCIDVNEYERERILLKQQPREYYKDGKKHPNHLVYFSSLCTYYSNNLYANHKSYMEGLVKASFFSYTIVRIGNIDWGKNPHTLINYLRAHPEASIQNTYRHILSLAEFRYWMNLIQVPGRNEMNIPGKMVYVPELAKELKYENTGFVNNYLEP